MSRYLPTLRGWAALVLPLVGNFLLLAIFPARFIESGVGVSIADPVAPSAWILGGVLILLCVAVCVEALRRGSHADRIVACLAALLTLGLICAFFGFMFMRVRPSPI